MPAPITWQNVQQGDASTAWRAMDSAQKSINGAFGGVQDQIGKAEAIDAANQIAIRKNNTADYLDKVATLGQTPEALQAAIKSGAIDQLKASYGANIDHDAVRGAAENLLNQRYAQATAAIGYDHTVKDEAAAPFQDAYRSATLKFNNSTNPVDKAAAAQAMTDSFAAYQKAGGRAASALDAFGVDSAEQAKERARTQGTYDRAGVMQAANITHLQNSDKVAFGQLGVSQGQLANAVAQTGIADRAQKGVEQDRLDNRTLLTSQALAKANTNQAGSTEGTQFVNQGIKEAFGNDSDSAINARRAFNEILKQHPNISASDALNAVTSTDKTRWYEPNSWLRGNAAQQATDLTTSAASIARQQQASAARDIALNNYQTAKAAADAGPLGTLRAAATAAKVTAAVDPTNTGLTKAGTAVGNNTDLIAAKNAAYLKSVASNNSPVASDPIVPPTPTNVVSPNLGGIKAPDVSSILPPVIGMQDKNSAIGKYMAQNSKIEQAATAAKLAADSELAAKVAAAKTQQQVKNLLEASRRVRDTNIIGD